MSDQKPNLIKTRTDPRRLAAAGAMAYAQDLLYSIQRQFAAETLAFKAIRLSWEAARLAWYAIRDETDGDHLVDVKTQLQVVEEHLNRLTRGGENRPSE